MKFHLFILGFLFVLFYITLSYCQVNTSNSVPAFTFLIPGKFIYYENLTYTLKPKDTLVDLAVIFKVGYSHLVLANPDIDPWIPPVGEKIIIPKQILIPEEFISSFTNLIIINLPEMRLYYLKEKTFFTAPVGIGEEGNLPPLGIYTIIKKQERPTWYPPPSIRSEDPTLPEIIPPGPDNPLGDYALYLSRGLYAIHGTNKVYSIGRRTTHGCIRLYPEDIKFLFDNTPIGTLVKIVYEPYKIAIENDEIFIQVFPDIENLINSPLSYIIKKIDFITEKKNLKYQIDLIFLEKVLEKKDGLIYKIGKIIK